MDPHCTEEKLRLANRSLPNPLGRNRPATHDVIFTEIAALMLPLAYARLARVAMDVFVDDKLNLAD